ncbi:MAG TPA: hypothetical protein V6C85_18820 [Allocoleopsis sp.]
MKDADTLILKAFLAALCQQPSPLPEEVTIQLRDIAQSWETRILDLHDLAISTPVLAEPYQQSRRWLSSTAAERGMGLKFLPDDEPKPDNQEIGNISRDIGSAIKQTNLFFATLEADLNNPETPKISRDTQIAIQKTNLFFAALEAKLSQAFQVLIAPNPVEKAQLTFNP